MSDTAIKQAAKEQMSLDGECEYAYSESTRQLAQRIDYMTKSQLSDDHKREELDDWFKQMVTEMTGLKRLSGYNGNKPELCEWLRESASRIMKQTDEDRERFRNNPEVQRKRWFIARRYELERAVERRDEAMQDLSEPGSFDWGSGGALAEADAEIRVLRRIFRLEESDLSLEELKLELMQRLAMNTRSGGSSNAMSNVCDEYEQEKLANILTNGWLTAS